MAAPKKGHEVKPADFMPSVWAQKAAKRPRSPRRQFNNAAKNWMAAIKAQGKVVTDEKMA